MQDLSDTIISLSNLVNLNLQGNPISHMCKYRENIIANSSKLSMYNKLLRFKSQQFFNYLKLKFSRIK